MNRVVAGLGLIVFIYAIGCNNRVNETKANAGEKRSVSSGLKAQNYQDGLFSWENGIFLKGNQPFTGVFLQADSLGNPVSKQTYDQGKEEGFSEWYYPDGRVNARRYFHKGEKDSVHLGWWPNGNLRFEYHFQQGQYHGWFKEWYFSGKPLKAIWYEIGKEIRGTGWRENGKIYMSFEVRNGRLYGLVNPNLCYSLQKEKGVFVSAKQNKNPL
ncbi:MAG: hypothetical protein FGM61_13040 [Sediminibacterium sp.]|nr:hypothetical protein [Sediminibacterium sp.]